MNFLKKILVVEDEEDIQELLCTYLCDAGYEVTAACDGVQAIEQFHRGAFDLVLLDIMLPKIDGFGVCEVMRRESKVPIVMLTALDGEAQQLRGFDLEIDDYVTKPFSMPVFFAEGGRHFAPGRRRRAAGGRAALPRAHHAAQRRRHALRAGR